MEMLLKKEIGTEKVMAFSNHAAMIGCANAFERYQNVTKKNPGSTRGGS